MSHPEFVDRKSGLLEGLKEMFPFDWELVRHMGAEPVPSTSVPLTKARGGGGVPARER